MSNDVKRIVNGRWKENCYVIGSNDNAVLIIDPGSDAGHIIEYIVTNRLNVTAIFNTHAHYDHVGAVKELCDYFLSPFFLHSKDEKLLRRANLYKLLFDNDTDIQRPTVDKYFDQIDIPVQFGDFSIMVLFTPGHSEGSVCFLIENYLFTGDTIFNRGIGRIDLPGGNKPDLINSLRIIAQLPEDTIICPGHGKTSTLEYELRNNKEFMEATKSVQLLKQSNITCRRL